ncbi:MAG: hypothetical protein R8G66_16105 [Cytophagales bacterium]|nr:hypothetical protein [Cytophagales bacterium]
MELHSHLEQLIPAAANWILKQENHILKCGIDLSIDQAIDAHLIGVKDPSRIRLMEFEEMPKPEDTELHKAAEFLGLISDSTRGTSFRYGIAVRKGWLASRTLLVHEMTHTTQYEKLGGIENFLKQYILECSTVGYLLSPMEEEARKMERKICG